MIRENVIKIKECVPDSVTIVAVSKGRTPEQIKEVLQAGLTDIGENRVQEAAPKFSDIADLGPAQRIKWHMVGHLQTNKVKEAVRIFGLIHSVDSLRLAAEIDKQSAKINKVQDALVEVNTSGEAAKFGLKPEELMGLIKETVSFNNLRIKGLMTVAPLVDDPQKTRPYFKGLRKLMEEINAAGINREPLHILSMGMTDDYEVAIEEGSNMVRLGRAIFE